MNNSNWARKLGAERPPMSEDQIRQKLSESNRWGTNDQPELEDALVKLEGMQERGLAIVDISVEGDGDAIDVVFSRPVTFEDGLLFGRWADDVKVSKDGYGVYFWWD